MDYSGYGNEVLAPLAYDGDQEANGELVKRGNTVDVDRRVLQKTVVWLPSQPQGRAETGDTVVIENGSIVSINGVKVP